MSASLPTTDIDRSVDIYQGKLRLKVLLRDSNMVYFDAGSGSSFSVYLRGETKADHTIAGWEVDYLAFEVAEL